MRLTNKLSPENLVRYVGSSFKHFYHIRELDHRKCSNRENNGVLLARIKETNMFLRSDQPINVALITQNNSATFIVF